MKINKKLLSDINLTSVYVEVLSQYGYQSICDNPPDMWNDEEKRLFDIVTEIESKLKEEIIKKIQNKF
jgi:hypothetical protein